jgi:hypothetical protein
MAFVVFVVLSCAVIALGILRPAPASEHEVCWSCGQRERHKLWCPNR